MLRTILPALLLLTTLPLAAASECNDVPGTRVCNGEWTEGDACSQPETMAWGYTYVDSDSHLADAGASFEGSYSCWRFDDGMGGEERLRSEDWRASAYAADKRATLVWNSFERSNSEEFEAGCWTLVQTRGIDGRTEHDLGCPAGSPPPLDWGRLLA